jgi:PhnB protein
MTTHGQLPDPSTVDPSWKDKVLHARIELGGTSVMGADIPQDRFQPIRSAYLSLTVDSSEEAERIYALLTLDGEVYMELEETFFAHRFAMFRDRFGTSWMLMHERPMPSGA